MSRPSPHHPAMPWYAKGLILIAAGFCLLLGVIGLVLPVLPGLLFLGLAVWLLARVSSRAARYLRNHGLWQREQQAWSRAGHLSLMQRLQLGFWLGTRSLLTSLQRITQRPQSRR